MGGRGGYSRIRVGGKYIYVRTGKAEVTEDVTKGLPEEDTPNPIEKEKEEDFHIATERDETDILAIDAGYSWEMRDAQDAYADPTKREGGYSFAQNMNHNLVKNGPEGLTGKEARVYRTLMDGMTPIGHNLILNRATHAGIINRILGVRDYQRLSESELVSRLVGVEYKDDKFVSTAWDVSRNPFISGRASGGREVYMTIHAPSWTPAVVGDKAEAELVLKPGLSYRITGVRYTGDYAYPRESYHSGGMKRIQVDVEIIPS